MKNISDLESHEKLFEVSVRLEILSTAKCHNWCCVILKLHRGSKQKQDTKLLPTTSPNINRFSHFFADGLSSKFATNSCLNIRPRLKYVTTLPCEM